MWRSLAALLLMGVSLATDAYDIDTLNVSHDDGRYTVNFSVRLAASPEKVRALSTDYERLAQLSDLVAESRVLAVNGNVTRLKLVLRACVLFFCKSVSRVEDVVAEPNGDITTRALPEQSDFRVATERWRIQPEGNGTRFLYQAHLEPDFFIPPFVGPYIMRRVLERELRESAVRFERLAGSP
jgi:hypothetical protein